MATSECAIDDRLLPPLKGSMPKHGTENRRGRILCGRPDRGITPSASLLANLFLHRLGKTLADGAKNTG